MAEELFNRDQVKAVLVQAGVVFDSPEREAMLDQTMGGMATVTRERLVTIVRAVRGPFVDTGE